MASNPGRKPPNQALNMMAHRKSDTKGVDCQKCSSICAKMSAAPTEMTTTA